VSLGISLELINYNNGDYSTKRTFELQLLFPLVSFVFYWSFSCADTCPWTNGLTCHIGFFFMRVHGCMVACVSMMWTHACTCSLYVFNQLLFTKSLLMDTHVHSSTDKAWFSLCVLCHGNIESIIDHSFSLGIRILIFYQCKSDSHGKQLPL